VTIYSPPYGLHFVECSPHRRTFRTKLVDLNDTEMLCNVPIFVWWAVFRKLMKVDWSFVSCSYCIGLTGSIIREFTQESFLHGSVSEIKQVSGLKHPYQTFNWWSSLSLLEVQHSHWCRPDGIYNMNAKCGYRVCSNVSFISDTTERNCNTSDVGGLRQNFTRIRKQLYRSWHTGRTEYRYSIRDGHLDIYIEHFSAWYIFNEKIKVKILYTYLKL
jgi:hypothetical protein